MRGDNGGEGDGKDVGAVRREDRGRGLRGGEPRPARDVHPPPLLRRRRRPIRRGHHGGALPRQTAGHN